MRIDSPAVVVLGVAYVVAVAAALAITWDRSRWVLRSALATLSVLAVIATALLQVNRMTEVYTSWSALAGTAEDGGGPEPGAAGPEPGTRPPGPDTGSDVSAAATAGRSRVVKVAVDGPLTGMDLPMFVYLPAAYARAPHTRFPVIEATDGYPGSPRAWINRLAVQSYLDREIAAGRMAPTVVLMPYQTPNQLRDTECTNVVHGPQAETYLTEDVPAYAKAHFHIRTDRAGWGLIGYSAGGYCTVNLALRHPGEYAAGVALSGYGEPGITIGDGSEKTTNNDDWRLAHLPQPAVSLYLGFATDDAPAEREALRLTALAHPPMQVTTATIAHGGHTMNAWKAMEPAAFDWLSGHLARPL